MLTENFAAYSSRDLHFCSLRVCMASAQDLLSFRVSVENCVIIVIGLPYMLLDLYSLLLLIFFVFCAFDILIITKWEEFLFWPNLLGIP